MGKIILVILLLAGNMNAFSSRDTVHGPGFSALGDDVSAISSNPATLFRLSRSLSEFMLSTDREFSYGSFYIGWYLASFPLLDRAYYSSINLGIGLENTVTRDYFISLGGTLIRFLKYGLTIRSIKAPEEKYVDADAGLLATLLPWLDLGLSIRNFRNRASGRPASFVMGLCLNINEDITFTSG
ncbi:MAG: hypothetical protein PHF84_12875, partial [bacterium]|nr:hypothetical protein [bacterium]